jgi:hypothetical protein
MGIFRNPLVVHHVNLSTGVSVTLNGSMGTNDDPGIENHETDLLVLTQMSCSHLSEGAQKIDSKLNSALSKAIKEANFTGLSGETVLLDCRSNPLASQKYILLVGLGDLRYFKGSTVCGLMRKSLEVAKELGVRKMTMSVFPNRQTEGELTLAGSAAIMTCRVETFGKIANLEEIEFFCTPQARRHFQDGLLTKTPHCTACSNPHLGDE